MCKYKWRLACVILVISSINSADAVSAAYCELNKTPKSAEFRRKFTERYRNDKKYARAYDASLRKLKKAEVATGKAMASLDKEISRIEAQLRVDALAADRQEVLRKQLSQKMKERDAVKKYKCETLVPARNKIRTLGELLL